MDHIDYGSGIITILLHSTNFTQKGNYHGVNQIINKHIWIGNHKDQHTRFKII